MEEAVPNREVDPENEGVEEEVKMEEDKEEEMDENVEKLSSQINTKDKHSKRKEGRNEEEMNEDQEKTKKYETEGVVKETLGASRGPESTIHTTLENLHLKVREEAASEAWHRYEALTSTLSQELCEQLRLVLEPSQATKLR
ncbi:midasin-like [Saccostrea cucullata]|uniref:midasin-like n=1 Tax=Saccostrea cuccullata TaxID=36930 RepID=UPI002ED49E23